MISSKLILFLSVALFTTAPMHAAYAKDQNDAKKNGESSKKVESVGFKVGDSIKIIKGADKGQQGYVSSTFKSAYGDKTKLADKVTLIGVLKYMIQIRKREKNEQENVFAFVKEQMNNNPMANESELFCVTCNGINHIVHQSWLVKN